MSINKPQAQMLTNIAILRRPKGAPRWDEAGVMAAIQRIASWPIQVLIDEVLAHAADEHAKNPGAIGKGYTPKREPVEPPKRLHPRGDEACWMCGGFKHRCGHDQHRPHTASDQVRLAAIAEARQALRTQGAEA